LSHSLFLRPPFPFTSLFSYYIHWIFIHICISFSFFEDEEILRQYLCDSINKSTLGTVVPSTFCVVSIVSFI
jgi:hypothetical protein